MTYEEAKEAIENPKTVLMVASVRYGKRHAEEVYKTVIKALDKQIAKKPIYWNNEMYICPNCHRAEYIKQRDGLDVYCGGCGQLIDWSK